MSWNSVAVLGIWAIVAPAAVAQTPAAAKSSPPPAKLALVGGMLIDGYEVPPLHHAAVLIEGNRIVWVGRAADADIPGDATRIDTRGRVMLPGLVELHAHLMLLGHGSYERWFPWVAERAGMIERVMEISAKQLLAAGVTTAVDLGAPLEPVLRVRDRVHRGEASGPRLHVSGPWIARFAPAPVTPTSMVWPESTSFWWPQSADTPEDGAKAVDALAAAGVDVIKTYVGLSADHYRAIVEAAHRHGLEVFAHTIGEQWVRNAVDGGVDVLVHAGSGASPQPYSPELVRDIVHRGIGVTASAAYRSWVFPATLEFPERLEDPRLEADFGPEIYREVQDSWKDGIQVLSYFRTTPERDVFYREAGLKQFIDAGAIMAMGTDSGTPLNFHTEALWREIKAHVDMGMSPQRAICAATRVASRLLGRGAELGTIERGKLADIIVVRGNPLFDITALADVVVVVKDGVVHKGGPGERASRGSVRP